MPGNAPAMRKAGAITSAGWPRLQPGATRARTPGTAALAGSDCFPLSISPHLSLLHFHGERWLAGASNAAIHRIEVRPRGFDPKPSLMPQRRAGAFAP